MLTIERFVRRDSINETILFWCNHYNLWLYNVFILLEKDCFEEFPREKKGGNDLLAKNWLMNLFCTLNHPLVEHSFHNPIILCKSFFYSNWVDPMLLVRVNFGSKMPFGWPTPPPFLFSFSIFQWPQQQRKSEKKLLDHTVTKMWGPLKNGSF